VAYTLAQLRAGDDHAWNLAFRELYDLARTVLRHKAGPSLPDEEIEDIASEAISKLIRRDYPETIDTIQAFKKYLARIALNSLYEHCRQQGAIKRGKAAPQTSLDDLEESETQRSVENDPEQAALETERACAVVRTLEQVPDPYRGILHDQFFSGLKHEEIAAKHRLKLGSIGVYLERGKQKLRALLLAEPEGRELFEELRL
jgi:RNA polymerase sigma factor (sigma-70 family)